MSFGLVMDEQMVIKKKAAFKEASGKDDVTLEDFYLDQIKFAPDCVSFMTEKRELVKVGKDGGPHVKQAADYSYTATHYAGPGYRMVGDAGCKCSGNHASN
jgi:flavine halogenase